MSRNARKAIDDGMIPEVTLTQSERDKMSDEAWDAMEVHHVTVADRYFEVPMVYAEQVARKPMSADYIRRHLTIEWDAIMLQSKLAWR
jgi:hypothetical protein